MIKRKILIVTPLQEEYDELCFHLVNLGLSPKEDKIGKLGERELLLNDFGRKLLATGLDSFYLERYIKEVTGKDLNLEAL